MASPKSKYKSRTPTKSSNEELGNTSMESNVKRFKRDIANSSSESNPLNFYFTKVNGIANVFNEFGSIGIKDILDCNLGGKLIESCQFNFLYDVEWLIQQYPQKYRSLPLMLVYQDKSNFKSEMEKEIKKYNNIKGCPARLCDAFGTHHTKMMLLKYEQGLRVVVHTANLVPGDWNQKTQGAWCSPIFPPSQTNDDKDTSITKFKHDLIEYLDSYNSPGVSYWSKIVQDYDMSSAKVYLIGSSPGRHVGPAKLKFGHLKLRKILKMSLEDDLIDWSVVSQFSSIGSLGPSADKWLTNEFLSSLAATCKSSTNLRKPHLKLVYPSVEDIRQSLEGYCAGLSVPYMMKTAKKQEYLNKFMHRWMAESKGRSIASPHIKSYARFSPDCKEVAWFLLTSANLSKAAWGCLEKNSAQLAIRSYELGVLFLPKLYGSQKVFNVSSGLNVTGDGETIPYSFPLPYDLPLVPYTKFDEPWVVDKRHEDEPDTHGNVWVPH